MNEKLSALMDGELDRGDAMVAIKTLGQDSQQRGDWDCYHLIGDALRGDSSAVTARRKACAESIFAKLAAEPTILAPAAISVSVKLSMVAKPAVIEKKTRMVLAMAASVVTVTAIGVIALRQQNGTVVPLQVVQQVATPLPTAPASAGDIEANKRVNDYLVIHRQFANASAFQPASLKQSGTPQSATQQLGAQQAENRQAAGQ